MAELKPCPFCGSDVVHFDKSYSYFREHVIYCEECDIVFTRDFWDAEEADIIEAWNRRPGDGREKNVC